MKKTVLFLKEGELGETDKQMITILWLCPMIKVAQSALRAHDRHQPNPGVKRWESTVAFSIIMSRILKKEK